MTPPAAGGRPGVDVSTDICGLPLGGLTEAVIVAEDLLDLVAALLKAAERQAERGDAVPDRVVGAVVGDGHEQRPLVRLGTQGAPGSSWRSASAPSSTSMRSVWLALVKLSIVSARSSLPASIATRPSQIRSISPSRWLATTMGIPNSAPIRSINSSIAFLPAGSRPLVR